MIGRATAAALPHRDPQDLDGSDSERRLQPGSRHEIRRLSSCSSRNGSGLPRRLGDRRCVESLIRDVF